MASKPSNLLILLLSLLIFFLLISTVQCHDLPHAIGRSATGRRSRLAYHHVHRLRAVTTHRYVLEEQNTTNNKNHSSATTKSNSTSNSTTPAQAPSAEEHHSHRSHKHRVRNWIIGFFVGSLAGVVSGLLMSVLFRLALNWIRGRYRMNSGVVIFGPKLIKKAELLAFLEKDDGLSALTVIGRGGCGEVYKAQLPVDSEGEEPKYIAIKKIKKRLGDDTMAKNLGDEESRQLDKWMRQIQSEIRTVGHIRHRNLLPLAAHVQRPDCHYLVYEFMEKGSLHNILKDVAEGRAELPWAARLRVAVGIAAGLEYLHVSQRPQIIHRDLKPANILLDDDMEPRIADFGLAKAMPDANTHISTSNIAGTVGYIAPEYHQTLKFTSKCDIYSFGVILAVLVTGKEPSDPFFLRVDEIGLVKWLRGVMLSGDYAEAIDKTISESEAEEQMLLVLRIACFCTSEDPKERPSAKDVRCMLSQIRPLGELV